MKWGTVAALLAVAGCKSIDPLVGTWTVDDHAASITTTFGPDGRYSSQVESKVGPLKGMVDVIKGTWTSTSDEITVVESEIDIVRDPTDAAADKRLLPHVESHPITNSYRMPSRDELDADIGTKELVLRRKN
jgi:hypothetical protein